MLSDIFISHTKNDLSSWQEAQLEIRWFYKKESIQNSAFPLWAHHSSIEIHCA